MQDSTFVEAGNTRALEKIRNQVCLIVRQPEPSAARILKNNGCKVGYDLLDRPVSDYHDLTMRGKNDGDFDWARYAHSDIDFYVVNNALAKARLTEALTRIGAPRMIHVIPHHTVNFNSKRNVVRERVERVGYVGFPNQFSSQDVVKDFCTKLGVTLVSVNPATRDECVNVMSTLDIGVVFVEQVEKIPYTLRYKPNTKLSNFQSFGIPTIAVPYDSFVEFGGSPWVKVESLNEFCSNLDTLVQDFERRSELNEAGWKHAQRFQIDNVVREFYGAL